MEEDSRDAVPNESLSPPPKVRRVGEPERLLVPENEGFTLFQVFSARFVNYEPVSMPEIYGVIFLLCSASTFVLFERIPGDPDPLPIDRNGFLKLTGPSEAHLADGPIGFHAFLTDLKGHMRQLRNRMWYGSFDECPLLCNKLLVKRWDTMIGTVELSYAVFTESVTASLEVNLVRWKDDGKSYGRIMGPVDDEIEVFGEITSRVKMLNDAGAKNYMFEREKEMCSRVRPGEAIPLSRSYMVCPIRSSILLHVALYHPNIGGDDLIVNDDVEVPAIQRSAEFVMESECARIQLKINFFHFD
ncbi:rRNA N-glycosidase [Rhynchospora pubera]|uniref:rRNA N-glycosidase n=1 Tax=Rhynchospora pubera TaxID=906938 RepID=A0AAV8F5G1_9POAL|nr:rRNA N-glycosidase [Rhynchospora pubera]